ncbi:hypothetical protein Q31a_23840 [Aureliella helgolandensis]|uniref:Uncharacterized protein n=1 Tax=Aureliella helgolandensis TaxID=2527968 RepID=A0A518G653_9BACT|nr:hypothetical protein Q31a_23840 [Aureliella helgolandensis]
MRMNVGPDADVAVSGGGGSTCGRDVRSTVVGPGVRLEICVRTIIHSLASAAQVQTSPKR